MAVQFIWEVLPLANWIISIAFIAVVYAVLFFIYLNTIRRITPFIFLASLAALSLVAYIFNLMFPFVLILIVEAIILIVVASANIGDINQFVANPFKKIKTKSVNFGVEKIFDRESFNKKIETAVLNLSKTKTGAIITFEKNKSLKNFIKNGVPVNAPVSPELLYTIFYPGTRLHDGATIIHGDQIVASAVFYNLTTQPFAVKYGSRHRAAIGISEVSDAVTVVVSEETGRISFAVNGELEPVDPDNFLRVFETYMSEDTVVDTQAE